MDNRPCQSLFDVFGLVDAVFDDVACHETACFFGVEADDAAMDAGCLKG